MGPVLGVWVRGRIVLGTVWGQLLGGISNKIIKANQDVSWRPQPDLNRFALEIVWGTSNGAFLAYLIEMPQPKLVRLREYMEPHLTRKFREILLMVQRAFCPSP